MLASFLQTLQAGDCRVEIREFLVKVPKYFWQIHR